MKTFTEELRYQYPLNSVSRVMDVGCFEGNWSSEIFKRYGCLTIGFEPIPEFFWQCVRKLHPKGCMVLPYGLGAYSRPEKMFIHGCMSGIAASGEERDVSILGIESFLNNMQWDQVDLLKLNCEGMEFEILEHVINHSLAYKFNHLQIQFHSCIACAEERMNSIRSALEKTHVCEFSEPWIWDGWSRR